MAKREYSKPPLSFLDQLSLLKTRGLKVNDEGSAVAFLEYVNYYRFSAYCLPFEKERHAFLPGTTFVQIQELYKFDRSLRGLVAQALETAEINIRTRIASILGHRYGPFAHLNIELFDFRFKWKNWNDHLNKETERSRETFVGHFRNNYVKFPDMPIWVITEIMSFGSLSHLYKGLKRKHQKTIAKEFSVDAPVLQTWLHTLTYLRNLCAHHSRLWNRILAIKYKLPYHGDRWISLADETSNDKIFRCLVVLRYLLFLCDDGAGTYDSWGQQVVELLSNRPSVPDFHRAMGIPFDWKQSCYWNFK